MIIKNRPVRLEFGDYGNFATLTPIEIKDLDLFGKIVITMGYTDGRTIDLCFDKDEVNIKSFGGQE